jgi:hypothetical protein
MPKLLGSNRMPSFTGYSGGKPTYKFIVDFWDDPRIRNLNPTEKLIAAYLLTTPFGHYTGLFTLPLIDAAVHLDLPERKVLSGIRTLSCANPGEEPFLEYDEARLVLWMRGQLEKQTPGTRMKQAQREKILRHVRRLPRSHLIERFLDHYQYILGASLEEQSPIVIPGTSKKRGSYSS